MSNAPLPMSVIMVSYHTGDVLQRAVASVLTESVAELIIVNNGNPEAAFRPIRDLLAQRPECQLIEGQGNVGYSRACNLGADLATQPYLLFLNPDTIVSKGALTQLFNEHQQLPCPALSSAWVTEENGQVQRGTLRNQLTPLGLIVEALKLHRRWSYFSRWSLNHDALPDSTSPYPVSAFNGACVFLPAALFAELEGFDEDYFLHFEDLDLFKRAHPRPLYLHPNVHIQHAKGSSDVDQRALNTMKYRSFCLYFQKHYPWFWHSPLGWLIRLIFESQKQRIFSK